MIVPARNADREAICPVCETLVAQVGEFCSRSCYAHFLVAVSMQSGIVEIENLVDLTDMPWYRESNGLNTTSA